MSGDLDPIDGALRVTAVLDTLGVRYTIGGSVAGEPRSTSDIDEAPAIDLVGRIGGLLFIRSTSELGAASPSTMRMGSGGF